MTIAGPAPRSVVLDDRVVAPGEPGAGFSRGRARRQRGAGQQQRPAAHQPAPAPWLSSPGLYLPFRKSPMPSFLKASPWRTISSCSLAKE